MERFKFVKSKKILILLLLVGIISGVFVSGLILKARTNAEDLDVTRGLIGYWDIDNGNNWEIRDISGHKNNGYNNGALRGVVGISGIALLFDGSDYVTMGNVSDFNFDSSDGFSLCAWVKLDKKIKDYSIILGKASSSSLNGYMLRYETNGNLAMRIVGDSHQKDSVAIARGDYRDNKWHFVVGVIDRINNTNTIYVDGVKKAQVKITRAGDIRNNYHFNMGALNNGSVGFRGVIDEARVYNRILSYREVQKIYIHTCPECSIWNYSPGSLLRTFNSNKVYYINRKHQKKWIINERVFNLYNNKWEDVILVSPLELEKYPTVNLVRAENDYKVYLIKNGTKKWIRDFTELENQGYQWEDVDVIKPEELAEYKEVE